MPRKVFKSQKSPVIKAKGVNRVAASPNASGGRGGGDAPPEFSGSLSILPTYRAPI